MIRPDMPEVLEIELNSFEFPWHEEDFIRCFRQRNCIGMVAEYRERIVGFMVYELHKRRLHILNFAVHKSMRTRGVGRQMTEKLQSKLSAKRRTQLTLEVPDENLGAHLFFQKLGFRGTSVLRNYCKENQNDAYLLQFDYVPDRSDETVSYTARIEHAIT